MRNIFQILSVIFLIFILSLNTLSNPIEYQLFHSVRINFNKSDSVYKFYKEKLNVYKYPIREKLPLIKIPNQDSTQTTKNEKVNIKVVLPSRIRYANIYLFINQEKIDLYYAVNGGEYTFRNVRLLTGKNNIELFYTLGNIRSNSTSFLINKE